MASGGIRYDFTEEDNITPGEYREIEITITDVDGNPASAGAWEFAWFLVEWLSSGNGIDALDGVALLKKDDTVSVSGSVATVPLLPPDLLSGNLPKGPKKYFYEFWRTDVPNTRRLSFGDFPVIG